jgi:hypothetical protein
MRCRAPRAVSKMESAAMGDSQIISVAIVALAVITGAIFSNSRIGDLNNRIGDVSRRIDDMRDILRAEMSKNHSEMLHRFADLDSRLTRVEQRIERIRRAPAALGK